ncbi:MAG: Beta-lactamase [Parcubacteria group bacterium GW2011_GWC2_42_11]|nr:MAG: Beta-lactamase [Parcubacteria group bacterium GW2011_GWC2_42_11]
MHMKNHLVNLEQKNNCIIGVEVRDITTHSTFFAHQEKMVLSSASCIKLFFAGAVLEVIHKKNLSLASTLLVDPSHFVPGASVLADLKTQEMRIDDLLYLLLAHSDTTAQNTLEQLISSQEVNEYIQRHGFLGTTFVSKNNPTKTVFPSTTPNDGVTFMERLWDGETFEPGARKLMLTYLAQSRHTHFGLRHLPTSLNMKDPIISERYSKAGKVHHTVNDTVLLKTPKEVLSIGVFVDNFVATENFNSVDNKGILLVSDITRDLFTEWYQSVS